MGSATMPRRPGASCGNWVGVASGRWVVPWSGTRRRSGGGNRSAGPRLKKSPERKPYDRLHRRKRTERATTPLPHLGAAGTDAGAAISFQLEDTVGDGRRNVVEFLFPPVPRHDPQSASGGVLGTSHASSSGKLADRLGRAALSPQSDGMGLRAPATR